MVSREFGLKSPKSVEGTGRSFRKTSTGISQTNVAVRATSTTVRLRLRDFSRLQLQVPPQCA
jgi:hypothetical protein